MKMLRSSLAVLLFVQSAQAPQNVEHIFQNCIDYETQRHAYWPNETTQAAKLHGYVYELQNQKWSSLSKRHDCR